MDTLKRYFHGLFKRLDGADEEEDNIDDDDDDSGNGNDITVRGMMEDNHEEVGGYGLKFAELYHVSGEL